MSRSRKPFTPFVLDNTWRIDFPAEPAGVLRLGPGLVRLEARLVEQYRAEDGWYTILTCELRLADAEGRRWQADSTFGSDWLLYPVIDLSRQRPGRWLRNAPAEWREALQKRALARDIPHTYDDRFYRYVWLDNTFFVWQFKYLGAGFTIAALGEDRMVVSVADLFCSWNPGRVEGPDGAPLPAPPPRPAKTQEEVEEEEERAQEEGESGDYDHAPPVAYEIEAGRLLFHNTALRDEDEGWSSTGVPRPLVWRRARGKGEPQAHVTFHPGARPSPSSNAPEGGADGFVPIELTAWYPLELQTDAGGLLRLDAKAVRFQLELERHPESASQPVDVLRCRLRLADEAGDLWEGVSHFTPEFFFQKLIDLDRIDSQAFFQATDAPLTMKHELVSGIRGLLDDGGWRYLLASDDLVAFRGKDQKVSIAIGIVGGSVGGDELAVRISGLTGRRRPVEVDHTSKYVVLDPEARSAEVPGWDHEQPLPPFVYSLPVLEAAFHNTTFAVDDGFWHQSAIPIPVIFQRVGKAEPAEGVRFVPEV